MIVKKLITNCLLLVLLIATAKAQSAFSGTGGDLSGTGGSVSYSIGIVSYTSHSGASGSIVQGVQQPYEISVISGVEALHDLELEILAYPNPASEKLYLKTANSNYTDLSYQLYHINGSMIKRNKIVNSTTNIDVGHLVPATYFLKIMKKNTEIKSFKIIKN